MDLTIVAVYTICDDPLMVISIKLLITLKYILFRLDAKTFRIINRNFLYLTQSVAYRASGKKHSTLQPIYLESSYCFQYRDALTGDTHHH